MDFAELPAAPGGDVHEMRVDGPRALLQAVPYLLGFHPHDSLVLVGAGDGAVRVTARLDLADTARPGPLEHTGAVLARAGADSVLAVVYDAGDAAPSAATEALPARVADAATAAGLLLVDAYLVRRGRWWSRVRHGTGWGTGPGEPVDDPPTAFAAAATVAGLTALPSRRHLMAVLDPGDGLARESLRPMIAAIDVVATDAGTRTRAQVSPRTLTREVFAAARCTDWDSPPLPDPELARLAAALSITAVRDSVWLAVDDGILDGRALWAQLARRVPGPYDCPALFLYGWSCWRHGDGASAQDAVARALAGVDGYPAAELLQVALSHGLDPRRVPRLRHRKRGGRASPRDRLNAERTRGR